jgi:hypothetical protein
MSLWKKRSEVDSVPCDEARESSARADEALREFRQEEKAIKTKLHYLLNEAKENHFSEALIKLVEQGR